MKYILIVIILLLSLCNIYGDLSIVRLKYRGGGDWYNDPSIIPNLTQEINKRTEVRVNTSEVILSLSDEELFRYPFLFITGHGNIKFSDDEVKILRTFLSNGGFLYADDDYGMDEAFRREIKRVFPDKELVEIPYDHSLYHSFYDLDALPKIHKHDGGPPKGFGIFDKGRMVLFYTYETNISDGWADPEVHMDPPEKREEALRMGINIFLYALTH
ncbi:MAG: DUF4159 domain-containing protein [Candidatus Cloacimonadota bacterium]|nr:DUF4159 domain-containing protein [candidate division WOR-3 bacterium]TET77469.1 MAG: DUF4159 domain-containing protein [Candidatus Cloacimonadota bacterium]